MTNQADLRDCSKEEKPKLWQLLEGANSEGVNCNESFNQYFIKLRGTRPNLA